MVVAVIAGARVSAAQTPAPLVAPPSPPPPPALVQLVRESARHNLNIESERLVPQVAAAAIQRERGVFDPQLQLQPGFGRTSRTVFTPDGVVAGSLSTASLAGGAGGLLPYSAAFLTGNLPTGTQYAVRFQSSRQAQDALLSDLAQTHPVQFNTLLTMSVAQPLLRGAGSSIARAGIRVATIGADASRARFGRALDETIASVETAYWSLAAARGFELAAEESLQRAQTLLGRNEQLLQLQLVSSVDVLTARQAVAARGEAVIAARAQREDAADALVFLVYGRDAPGHLADTLPMEPAALPDTIPAVLDGVEDEAMAARRDLAGAKLQLAQTQVGVEVAQESLRASLNLVASYTAQTSNTSTLRLSGAGRAGDLANLGWQGGLLITIPVGNNVSRAAYQQATLAETQQRAVVAATENDIRQDVRQAVRALRAGRDRVRQATESLDLARQQYDAENQRLQLGLSDSFRLLQVEEEVQSAQQALLEARFAVAQALVSHDLARGYSAAKFGIEDPGVTPAEAATPSSALSSPGARPDTPWHR